MGQMLTTLSWKEAKQRLAEHPVVLIPTGSIEQHGPHLPVGTDLYAAEEIARRVAARGDLLITPTIPVGYAEYHSDFAGTLSLSEETLTCVYTEICYSLVKHGATHIVFANAHGGNQSSITRAMRALRNDGILAASVSWYEVAGILDPQWALVGHGDHVETSVMLSIRPDTVRLDSAKAPVRKNLSPELLVNDMTDCRFRGAPIHVGLRTKDCTDTGDLVEYGIFPDADHSISPGIATSQAGDEILEAVALFIVDFAREFRKLTLASSKETVGHAERIAQARG